MKPEWLKWARMLQAVAQTGIYYSEERPDSTGEGAAPFRQIRAIAAEMVAAGSDEDIEHISGLLQRMSGIASPQAALSGAVFNRDKILLVRERESWALPGTTAAFEETFGRTVSSAIREETGYRVNVAKLAAVYDGQGPPFLHRYHLIFACRIAGARIRPGGRPNEVAFFSKQELQTLTVGGLTIRQISRLFEHARDASLPADFD